MANLYYYTFLAYLQLLASSSSHSPVENGNIPHLQFIMLAPKGVTMYHGGQHFHQVPTLPIMMTSCLHLGGACPPLPPLGPLRICCTWARFAWWGGGGGWGVGPPSKGSKHGKMALRAAMGFLGIGGSGQERFWKGGETGRSHQLFAPLPLERGAMGARSRCNFLAMIPNTGGGLGLVGVVCTVPVISSTRESR